MVHEYVYLVQEREFIKTNEKIYKIGRTKKENLTRFNQYPKGSALLLQLTCKDCVKLETELIKCFIGKYKQCTDIGNEYFEGDYEDMIEDIFDIKRKLFKVDPEMLEVAKEIPSMPDIKTEIQHQEAGNTSTPEIIQDTKPDVLQVEENAITTQIVDKKLKSPETIVIDKYISSKKYCDYKIFECKLCYSKFKSSFALKRHLFGRKTPCVEKVDIVPEPIDNLVCKYCSKIFASKKSVNQHINHHCHYLPGKVKQAVEHKKKARKKNL